MNYGMIIKIGMTRAIVMNDAMAVVRINKKPGMVKGASIYYLEEDLVKGYRGLPLLWIRTLAVAAMLVLMVLALQYTKSPMPLGQETYAIISMDINPSVEMAINSEGNVIRIRAINKDGEALIKDNYETLTLEEALVKLLNEAKIQGYLEASGAVLLATSQEKKSPENEFDLSGVVTDFIKNHQSDYTFIYCEGDAKELVLAKEQSLSLGRYKLTNLIDDDLLNDGSVSQMPISELVKNTAVVELLQEAQNKASLQMYRAGASLFEVAPSEVGPQSDLEPCLLEGYSHQSIYQSANQEKDGGGGQNADNGQQKNGTTTQTPKVEEETLKDQGSKGEHKQGVSSDTGFKSGK